MLGVGGLYLLFFKFFLFSFHRISSITNCEGKSQFSHFYLVL